MSRDNSFPRGCKKLNTKMVATKRKLKQNAAEPVSKKLEQPVQIKERSTQSHSDTEEKTPKGWCSGSLKYIILMLFVPGFLNHAALYREARGLKPPGELYDIGKGQKLFMGCMGTGKPTVILDAPTGMASDAWTLIGPALSKITHVCVYDRAGLGFSDRPFVNRTEAKTRNRGMLSTTERMVDDFHRLFTGSSSQPKPFILVGAEIGAVNTRFYTQLFEDDVAGLILINPLIEQMFSNHGELWTNTWLNTHISSLQVLQFCAATGLSRLGFIFGLLKPPVDDKLVSEIVAARQKYLMCKPGHLSSAVDEYYFANESLSQMRTLSKFKRFNPGNIGITVLTSKTYSEKSNDPLNKDWQSVKHQVEAFFSPGIETIQLLGSADTALIKNSKTIINVIARHIYKWRKSNSNNKVKAVNM